MIMTTRIPIESNLDCEWAILYEVSKFPQKPNTRIFIHDLEKRIPEYSQEELEISSCVLINNKCLTGKYNGKHLIYISGITEKGIERIN